MSARPRRGPLDPPPRRRSRGSLSGGAGDAALELGVRVVLTLVAWPVIEIVSVAASWPGPDGFGWGWSLLIAAVLVFGGWFVIVDCDVFDSD